MVVEPFEALAASVASASVAPIPTIINPVTHYSVAGATGERTLWVVFVIMAISSLVFYAMAFRVPAQKRFFHIITAFITTFATISYFAMATGDGISYNKHTMVKSHKKGIPDVEEYVYRAVYWARYVDWSVTTPLLLVDLAFLAGLNGASMLVTIVADLIMVLVGLFAAFSTSNGQKWGYYAMACAAYLVIVYQLAVNGRQAVKSKDSKTVAFFASLGGFTLLLWTAYPVVWGIADGSLKVGVDGEIIAYAVLDVLAKPVFGFWLLITHDASSATSMTMEGFWAHGPSAEGSIRVGDDDEGA